MTSGGLRLYETWGLRVESEVPVPEWAGFERPAGGGMPDVRISLGADAGRAEPPARATTELRDGEALLAFPSAGWYRVTGGERIEVTPARGVAGRETRLFLLGSAWGALCYQRGILPLHAAVVEAEGGAIALCGPSGSGKSTLAAALSRLGHRILGDDLCRAGPDGEGRAVVWPGTARLKLWNEALAALGWEKEGLERDHVRHEKFHVPLRPNGVPEPVPLRAVHLLEWGDERRERLQGREALRRFVAAATYRPDLIAGPAQVEAQWRLCLELVRQVPVHVLSRPRDFEEGERVARRLSRAAGRSE